MLGFSVNFSKSFSLVIILLAVFGVSSSFAQVAIYRLVIDKDEALSQNFPFYDAGFLVLPAAGGAGAMIFTMDDGQGTRVYARTFGVGEVFRIVDSKGKDRLGFSVVQSITGGRLTAWVFTGLRNLTVESNDEGVRTRVKTPRRIDGRAVVSDPETDMTEESEDGSIGLVGFVDAKGFFQKDRTARENKAGFTVEESTDSLIELLERAGYVEEGADDA